MPIKLRVVLVYFSQAEDSLHAFCVEDTLSFRQAQQCPRWADSFLVAEQLDVSRSDRHQAFRPDVLGLQRCGNPQWNAGGKTHIQGKTAEALLDLNKPRPTTPLKPD